MQTRPATSPRRSSPAEAADYEQVAAQRVEAGRPADRLRRRQGRPLRPAGGVRDGQAQAARPHEPVPQPLRREDGHVGLNMVGGTGLRDLIRADLEATVDPRMTPPERIRREIIGKLLLNPRIRAVLWFRLSHWLAQRHLTPLALLLRAHTLRSAGVEIHPRAQIGGGLYLIHSTGIVIGPGVVIGARLPAASRRRARRAGPRQHRHVGRAGRRRQRHDRHARRHPRQDHARRPLRRRRQLGRAKDVPDDGSSPACRPG